HRVHGVLLLLQPQRPLRRRTTSGTNARCETHRTATIHLRIAGQAATRNSAFGAEFLAARHALTAAETDALRVVADIPAAALPTTATVCTTGPGVTWPRATASRN